ncbi:hypothetical protein [Sneathiella sp.]|uniref:hypothetical protein n=1 Tax=Sneathiella sp. TaxID=1964365 RepID=UPI003565FB10
MADKAEKDSGPTFEKAEYKSKDIELITTSLEVPTLLVDGIVGTMELNGTSRFNFYEDKLDPLNKGIKRRHVVTLAMTNKVFQEILDFFNTLAKERKDNGGE